MRTYILSPYPVSLLITSNEKEYRKWQKKHQPEHYDKNEPLDPGCTHWDDGCKQILVWVDKDKKYEDAHIRIAAHEACHVLDAVWDHIGEDEPGVEVRAYMQGFITELIYEEYE